MAYSREAQDYLNYTQNPRIDFGKQFQSIGVGGGLGAGAGLGLAALFNKLFPYENPMSLPISALVGGGLGGIVGNVVGANQATKDYTRTSEEMFSRIPEDEQEELRRLLQGLTPMPNPKYYY